MLAKAILQESSYSNSPAAVGTIPKRLIITIIIELAAIMELIID